MNVLIRILGLDKRVFQLLRSLRGLLTGFPNWGWFAHFSIFVLWTSALFRFYSFFIFVNLVWRVFMSIQSFSNYLFSLPHIDWLLFVEYLLDRELWRFLAVLNLPVSWLAIWVFFLPIWWFSLFEYILLNFWVLIIYPRFRRRFLCN